MTTASSKPRLSFFFEGSNATARFAGKNAARAIRTLALFAGASLAIACDGSGETTTNPDAPVARDPVTGLTAEESKEVLAKVGDRTITLGEYALTLARMGQYERLRYQSPERQKELLDEMVRLELLAAEARRRGLHEKPDVRLRLDEALRDEALDELRRRLPKPEELSERDVRAYYDAHQAEFEEPERRRALVVVVANPELARRVTDEAKGADGAKWGELVRKYSLDRRGTAPNAAPEWAGDFGFVSAPGEKRGENPEVPEEVRAALFRLEKLGDVAADPIPSGGRHYVVRLGGTSAARKRSLRDADRTIRVELLRRKFLEEEQKLLAELKKKYPIAVDEKALASLEAKKVAPPSPAAPPSPKPPGTP